MSFSYDPLWKKMIDKKLRKEDLRIGIKASASTIAKMGRNEYVSMKILDDICCLLNCKVEEVLEYVPNKKEEI